MPKLVLITGATSGLGEALAYTFSQKKIPLLLVGRDQQKLSMLQTHLPFESESYCCDLKDQTQRQELIKWIRDKTPDLLINNAGFGAYGPTEELPLSCLQEMLAVNAQALMELSIEGAKALKEKKMTGTILNISSVSGFFPFPTHCVYAATKAFVNSFSQGFDAEMKPYGIRILTACPGMFNTPFQAKASHGHVQNHGKSSMSKEKVVDHILKQLKKKQSLRIIDFRYKIIVMLKKLTPSCIERALLKHSIKNYFTNREK